jgi:hypothetical protein
LAASRSPEVQALVAALEAKAAETQSLEAVKAFLDSTCGQIMRIKQIKPDLHRQ